MTARNLGPAAGRLLDRRNARQPTTRAAASGRYAQSGVYRRLAQPDFAVVAADPARPAELGNSLDGRLYLLQKQHRRAVITPRQVTQANHTAVRSVPS